MPSVGDEDGIAGADLGEDVGSALARREYALIAESVRAVDLEVVDLLQLRLDTGPVLVVLVRRMRTSCRRG